LSQNILVLTDSIADDGNAMVKITCWAEDLPWVRNSSQIELSNTQHYSVMSWFTSYNNLNETALTTDRQQHSVKSFIYIYLYLEPFTLGL